MQCHLKDISLLTSISYFLPGKWVSGMSIHVMLMKRLRKIMTRTKKTVGEDWAVYDRSAGNGERERQRERQRCEKRCRPGVPRQHVQNAHRSIEIRTRAAIEACTADPHSDTE